MNARQSLFGLLLLTVAATAFGLAFRYGGPVLWPSSAVAQAQTPPQTQTLTVAKDQKLKGTAWHCWSGGSCELWLLTKPRKADDKPETYVFQNADGSRKYVIKEQ